MATANIPALSSANSSIAELSYDVTIAVQYLRELAQHMKTIPQSFVPSDLVIVDEIVSSLKELDTKRLRAHELLEAETIKASILRHKLAILPKTLKEEIDAKVKQARESNAGRIGSMQSRIAELNNLIEVSTRSQQLLKMHNELLEYEQGNSSETYSELVKKLNNCMADKSKMQIQLNDLIEKLRDVLHKNEQLMNDMAKVDKDMEELRQKYTQEMEYLDEALKATKKKHRIKEEEKRVLDQQLKTMETELFKKEMEMKDLTTEVLLAESEVRRFEAAKKELKHNSDSASKDIQNFKLQCTKLEEETVKMGEDYEAKVNEILKRTEKIRKEIEQVAQETKELSESELKLKKEFRIIADDGEAQVMILKDIQNRVDSAKKTMVEKVERKAKMSKRRENLLYDLDEIKQHHEETVANLKQEIKSLQDQLTELIKTKEIVMEGYKEAAQSSDAVVAQNTEAITQITSEIFIKEKKSTAMLQKIAHLENIQKEQEESTSVLRQLVRNTHLKLEKTKETLSQSVWTLETNIADLTEELSSHNETLAIMKPKWIALGKEWEETSKENEIKKKKLIAFKSEKSALGDKKAEVNKEITGLEKSQKKLRMDTLSCRAHTRQCIRERTKVVEELEKQVVEASQKLLVINKENKKISTANDHFSKEIERLTALLGGKDRIVSKLGAALKSYRNALEDNWKMNGELDRAAAERDMVVLKEITTLRELSENRLELITNIHEHFHEELKRLYSYLEIAAYGNSSESRIASDASVKS